MLVEFALAFPVLMLMLLGSIDGGRLMIAKADQDHRTIVVAEWAAAHRGDSIASTELPGCTVTLDDTTQPGIEHAGSTCTFEPIGLHGFWDGLQVSSEADAVVKP